MTKRSILHSVSVGMIVVWLAASAAFGQQTTAFTYQGKLTDSGSPANGNYDLQFKLFDTVSVGTGAQQGATVTVSNVTATAGIFTVQLDFGAGVFPGAPRFLELGVKPVSAGSFTVLGPRQVINATPYAIKSANATTADGLSGACTGCVTSAQIQSLPTGSAGYVQNTSSPQAASNFNISGNGTAGGTISATTVNAATQYNLGGIRILSAGGDSNLSVGSAAGQGGSFNSFFGKSAGQSSTTSNSNSFFGANSGFATSTGGGANSFFGVGSGSSNSTGSLNAFFGYLAGYGVSAGSFDTAIGSNSGFGADLTNATAIGANAFVTQSNSLVLGSLAGPGTPSVNVGIGTTAPSTPLEVSGIVRSTRTGNAAQYIQLFGGDSSSIRLMAQSILAAEKPLLIQNLSGESTPGASNSIQFQVGTTAAPATRMIIDRFGNVGIGQLSPLAKLDIAGSLKIDTLTGGGDQQLCRNSTFNTIATCSSSLRYKGQIAPYTAGLELISRLHPISFSWKANGARDLGLGAEDVARVEPLLVTHNDKGEVEGVKYDHLNVVLINAIKQQQEQIETLLTRNAALSARLSTVERTIGKRARASRRRR